jgi:hypothetical protein
LLLLISVAMCSRYAILTAQGRSLGTAQFALFRATGRQAVSRHVLKPYHQIFFVACIFSKQLLQ